MKILTGVVALSMFVAFGFTHSASAACKSGSYMKNGKCIKMEVGDKSKSAAHLKGKMSKQSCVTAGGVWKRGPKGNQFSCGVSQPMVR